MLTIVASDAIKELINFNGCDLETWKLLINAHLRKMNFITNDTFALPTELILQLFIFYKQLEKFINPSSKVAVLSAFPIFLHDYYGNEQIKKRI